VTDELERMWKKAVVA